MRGMNPDLLSPAPPGSPELRERQAEHRHRRKLRWMKALAAVSVAASAAGGYLYVAHPYFIFGHTYICSTKAEALGNLKQIGEALMEFDGDYGSFPSAATAITAKENTGTPLTLRRWQFQ